VKKSAWLLLREEKTFPGKETRELLLKSQVPFKGETKDGGALPLHERRG